MRKKYIKVENIRLYLFSNAEFINFMERFMALLPIEKDEESQDAALSRLNSLPKERLTWQR